LYGADIGFEFHATNKVTLTGSYSYLSEECMDFNGDGDCFGVTDVALNAPQNKSSFGVQFDDKSSGVFLGGRVRYSDGFPMNSGVYLGDVESYTVVDVNGGYRVHGYKGFLISATINNLFNNKHQEWIGAPAMGMLALLKVQFEM
jgi:iron complex outermembrane receptor protein